MPISVLLAFVLLSAAGARAATPAQLFATDASGMVKIEVVCPDGELQQGSGFLLGPRVVMSARHVFVDQKGRECSASAVQEGSGKRVRVQSWMALRSSASNEPTDLALVLLAAPLAGYNFSISTTSPKPGQRVIALGYALGQPLSLNQGHLSRLLTRNKVTLLLMALLEAGGASGGPILDSAGKVIGLDQAGMTGYELAVDVPRLVRDDPGQLCFGVVAGQQATICGPGAHTHPLLERDGAPQLCEGVALDLPFQSCPKLPIGYELQFGVLGLESQCPQSGRSMGSGFLLGPRLMIDRPRGADRSRER